MDVAFYQLLSGAATSLESVLSKLLHKVLEAEKRVVVVCTTPEYREVLNTSLWTLGHASFLPHGSEEDGSPEDQPIWLTTSLENPNQGDVIVLLHPALFPEVTQKWPFQPQRVLVFFTAGDVSACEKVQQLKIALGQAATPCVTWVQDPKGGWQKGA